MEIQQTTNYLTVNQFIATHKAFSYGGMRALIFNANSNKLASSGAITRIGRKILINEDLFFEWVQAGAK
jgi:hypothetical protein